MVVTLDDNRDCGCCGQVMRKLALAAHYDGTVEIDVCEPCMLIWFDGAESMRLARLGLIELLRLIRDALATENPEQPQPISLTCPVCAASLQRSHNLSRFGRTIQMRCPEGHGYYQSFNFFLAEKGYYRRYLWADIRNLADSGRSLACICCGATLELQPVDECPYCGSPVGLVDPELLASAVDIQGASSGVVLAPTHSQVDCAYCGSRIDPFRDDCCPCCRTPFRPMRADGLSTVTGAVETAVGETTPILSRRLLDAAAAVTVETPTPQSNLGQVPVEENQRDISETTTNREVGSEQLRPGQLGSFLCTSGTLFIIVVVAIFSEFILLVFMLLGISFQSWLGSFFAKPVREFPGPWQTVEPGKPVENPLEMEIVEEGTGTKIELGDLIQVSHKYFVYKEDKFILENDWWLWIGFKSKNEFLFSTDSQRIRSALLGVREGASLRFLEANDSVGSAGELHSNPFGDHGYYSRKITTIGSSVSVDSYISNSSGYSLVKIKRVCKGPLQYRTVRLYDDSPIQKCERVLDCKMTREPRQGWIDEAKIEARCSDGKMAVFQYGPIESRNGKEWTGSNIPGNALEPWIADAWRKLPRGVRFVGNHAPVWRPRLTVDIKYLGKNAVDLYSSKTAVNTPVRIDIAFAAEDADGDRLTVHIRRSPENGALVVNGDGSVTYTPKPGWSGVDRFSCSLNDGLVESEREEAWTVVVEK